MVTTVTLNPCIDFTVSTQELRLGQLNFADHFRMDVSGKGINVSTVLHELGVETQCMGFNFTGNGHLLTDYLDRQGIPHSFVEAPGALRTNIKVVDRGRREMTEINGLGDPVDRSLMELYFKNLTAYARESSVLVFSGRIPKGAPENIYQKSMRFAAGFMLKMVVDAEGEPLRSAMRDSPYLIKPNLHELESAFGFSLKSREEILAACRQLIGEYKVKIICVSMGAEGAMIVDEQEAWYAPALDVEPKGFQGAGDSMLAGLCKGIAEKRNLPGMLRNGIAAASASIIREGTLLCLREDFEELREQVSAVPVRPAT